MSGLSDGQLAVARLLFSLPEAEGFALGGGAALLALGAIDRPTRDIDAFVASQPATPPGDVGPLALALQTGLARIGWTVAVARQHVTFTRLVATMGEVTVEIDLAVDSPPLFPTEFVLGLPVLAGQDLAAHKILAVLDRAEGRDYTDLRALADRYSPSECIRWAQELDSGISTVDIAIAFDKLNRLEDDELPCEHTEVPEVRSWFAGWAADLLQDDN